jgi:hypothetical protein
MIFWQHSLHDFQRILETFESIFEPSECTISVCKIIHGQAWGKKCHQESKQQLKFNDTNVWMILGQ